MPETPQKDEKRTFKAISPDNLELVTVEVKILEIKPKESSGVFPRSLKSIILRGPKAVFWSFVILIFALGISFLIYNLSRSQKSDSYETELLQKPDAIDVAIVSSPDIGKSSTVALEELQDLNAQKNMDNCLLRGGECLKCFENACGGPVNAYYLEGKVICKRLYDDLNSCFQAKIVAEREAETRRLEEEIKRAEEEKRKAEEKRWKEAIDAVDDPTVKKLANGLKDADPSVRLTTIRALAKRKNTTKLIAWAAFYDPEIYPTTYQDYREYTANRLTAIAILSGINLTYLAVSPFPLDDCEDYLDSNKEPVIIDKDYSFFWWYGEALKFIIETPVSLGDFCSYKDQIDRYSKCSERLRFLGKSCEDYYNIWVERQRMAFTAIKRMPSPILEYLGIISSIDNSAFNRKLVILILTKIGKPALDYLGAAALNDIDEDNREIAIKGLTRIGKPALDYLGSVALRDKSTSNRGHATKGLAKIGKPALEYLDKVARLDSDSDNRKLALEAIEKMSE